MSSHRNELAAAAVKVRSLSEQIPAEYRQPHVERIQAGWAELLERLEGVTERRAFRLIADWRQGEEERLSEALANAPLGVGGA